MTRSTGRFFRVKYSWARSSWRASPRCAGVVDLNQDDRPVTGHPVCPQRERSGAISAQRVRAGAQGRVDVEDVGREALEQARLIRVKPEVMQLHPRTVQARVEARSKADGSRHLSATRSTSACASRDDGPEGDARGLPGRDAHAPPQTEDRIEHDAGGTAERRALEQRLRQCPTLGRGRESGRGRSQTPTPPPPCPRALPGARPRPGHPRARAAGGRPPALRRCGSNWSARTVRKRPVGTIGRRGGQHDLRVGSDFDLAACVSPWLEIETRRASASCSAETSTCRRVCQGPSGARSRRGPR